MPRRTSEPEVTRTDCVGTLALPDAVPVLIVVGDPKNLGAKRAVLRINGSLEIGRHPTADPEKAWIIDDNRASRRHAIIEVDALKGTAKIVDLGSRNGTMVDGKAVSSEFAELAPGSMVFVGTNAAVFRFVSVSDLQAIDQDLADPFTPVATTSPEVARKSRLLRRLAKGADDLLLMGETGVGKEQFARAIHRTSERSGKFVAINCPALPGSLLESELFGYVKGAHSQATGNKLGLIEEAEHGTLFLDEFAEIAPDLQAKLLRFLEDRELQALGATKRRRVEVRIIAATNRDISALRQDIAARLGPEPIKLPPLRSHREDIAALAGHFLKDHPGMELNVQAFHLLCMYDWPDNIRGLKKALSRAADLTAAEGSNIIGSEHLPEKLSTRPPPPVASDIVELSRIARRSPRAAPSKAELEALLERNGWVVAHAAREIDRDHAVVWRWIKRYGLDVAGRARTSA
jgi:transcriptional regulator with PAS, ATPase and Fis domain